MMWGRFEAKVPPEDWEDKLRDALDREASDRSHWSADEAEFMDKLKDRYGDRMMDAEGMTEEQKFKAQLRAMTR